MYEIYNGAIAFKCNADNVYIHTDRHIKAFFPQEKLLGLLHVSILKMCLMLIGLPLKQVREKNYSYRYFFIYCSLAKRLSFTKAIMMSLDH